MAAPRQPFHILASAARWLERAAARSAPVRTTSPTTPGASAHDYGALWSPGDDAHARRLIFNDSDRDVFEQSGRDDAERVVGLSGPDATVLDLGCGIGRVAKHVAPRVKRLWAVDASEAMLELAREHLAGLDNVSFARCAGTTVADVPSGSVDFAYSLLVLQHLEREDAFALMREVRRMLAADGQVLFTFPNLLSDVYLQSFLDYVDSGQAANPVRARMYTPQEVERLLPAAGFVIQSIEPGVEMVVHASLK